jgi:hypothetical protein
MPAMTDEQKRALDEHAQTEPALNPRYQQRVPYLTGTELRNLGDAALVTTVAAAGAIGGAFNQGEVQAVADLANDLKAKYDVLAQAHIDGFGKTV